MDRAEFGKMLKDERKKKKLTQTGLANLLNVSQGAVARWEKGKNYPTLSKLFELANIFEIPFDDLMKVG